MAAVSKIVAVILFFYFFIFLYSVYIYICIYITFFALTLCYIILPFLSTLHGVYTRDCSYKYDNV